MISHGKEIKVFSGNSNPELAKAICSHLFKELGECSCANFADGANEDYSCVTLELTPNDANAVKAAIADTWVTLALISSANAGE